MRPGAAALEVFEKVVALPEDQRAAVLDACCTGRPGLRAEVDALLANDRTTARLPLGSPYLGPGFHALRFAEGVVRPIGTFPTQIGRYRVDAELGRGGMGIVYRAEQDQPRRSVALKLLVHGGAIPHGRAFFHHEAQALALLQHPGIVHVYDAGIVNVAGADLPFLAMELVFGEPLLAWAERNAPDVATRIRILVDVCAAVEAAHRAGVIHRDLKPGNILVESGAGTPRPRILDFGIATFAGTGDEGCALAGTVSHLSPEQAAGVPAAADARSDVYALGTIAYQLFTGVQPIDTRDVALAEALRRIREEEPPPLRHHARALPADLEPVVAAALAKSPEARYASARDFARDLERVLAHAPVSVRRPTAFYVLARFARRQRVLCASIAVAALAMVGGLATGWWAWSQASANLDRFVATSQFTVERILERLSRLAGTSTVRAEALQHLLPQVEECLRLRPSDRAALACEYTILRQLGDIEVHADRLAAALPLRQRALRTQERLLEGSGVAAKDRAEWATALVRLGDVELRLGQVVGRARYETAHETFAALAAEHATEARCLDDFAWSCDRLAHLAIDDRDFDRAKALLRERERLNEQLRRLRPGAVANFAGERAVQCLWSHLEVVRGRSDEQLRRLELAKLAARQRSAVEPQAPQAKVELASTLLSYVECAAERLGRAERLLLVEEALAILDGLLAQEPDYQVAKEVRSGLLNARRNL